MLSSDYGAEIKRIKERVHVLEEEVPPNLDQIVQQATEQASIATTQAEISTAGASTATTKAGEAANSATSAADSLVALQNTVQVRATRSNSKTASPVNVGSVGLIFAYLDSLTAGTGTVGAGTYTNWRKYFEPVLRGRFGDTGPGWHSFSTTTAADKSVSFGATSMTSVTLTGTFGTYSLDGFGQYRAPGAAGVGNMDWNFNQKWDTARVYYLKQPSGGSFGVRCSNTSDASITTVDTSNIDFDLGFVDIAYTGSGAVALAFRNVGANVCIFGAFFSLTGVSPIGLVSVAEGGRKLSDVAAQNSSFRQKWLTAFAPTHALINGGMNDRGTTNAATHYNDLNTIVTDIQSVLPACNITIIQSNEPNDATGSASAINFNAYTAQKIALAELKELSYVDLRDALGGGYATANSKGLMLDGVHPNDKGNRRIARFISDHLGLPWLQKDPGKTPSPGSGSGAVPIPFGTLTPKRDVLNTVGFPTGTAITLWTLGLGQAFPTALLKIRVDVTRFQSPVHTLREYYVRISNTTVSNTVTNVGQITDTQIFKEADTDTIATDITFSCVIESGKAVIKVTPVTRNWNSYYATCEWSMRSTVNGIQIQEN